MEGTPLQLQPDEDEGKALLDDRGTEEKLVLLLSVSSKGKDQRNRSLGRGSRATGRGADEALIRATPATSAFIAKYRCSDKKHSFRKAPT